MAPSRCWIDRTVLADLLNEARRWWFRETGGALLGWSDDNDVAIACVLGPGPGAVHRPRSFEPDGPWQAALGRSVYAATDRKVVYLGDWHTHPFSRPVPSQQDRSAAELIANDPAFRTPAPLSGIVGRTRRCRHRLVTHLWTGDALVPIETIVCRLDDEVVNRARSTVRPNLAARE